MEKTNNELIAEFMGFRSGHFDWLPNRMHRTKPNSEDLEGIDKDNLKYNTSWDWLMLVVEKIHKIKGVHYIIEGDCKMVIYYFGKLIIGHSSDNIMETVYNTVVDFIKWYNETKQP